MSTTTTTATAEKGATMPTTTFTATVIAADAATAIERAAEHAGRVEGLEVTGRVSERSLKHHLWTVELELAGGGDRNDAWVMLTSYGITPGDELGSVWQTVAGVGRFD